MVEELLNRSSWGLTSEQQAEHRALVSDFEDIFTTEVRDCTHMDIVQHGMDTGDASPIHGSCHLQRGLRQRKRWKKCSQQGRLSLLTAPTFLVVLVKKKKEWLMALLCRLSVTE